MFSKTQNATNWKFLLGILVFFTGVLVSSAQSTVTINGTVKDPSGAAIPGATVTVHNNQTGIESVAPAGADGHYTVLNLAAGFYDIRVAQMGFATALKHNQELLVGTNPTFDFSLIVSAVTETVDVGATAPDVEPTQSVVNAVLHTDQLDQLPVLSRNFAQLAALTPGVQTTSQVSVGFAVGGAVTGVTIGNSTQYETGYMVDNIPIVKPSDGGLYVALAQDWVQEFSVTASQAPAEYVGAVSGFINAVTRSGSNNIHGRAYTFIQNSSLNASNTNPAAIVQSPKSPSSSQRYGGMIGGPAIKDKLFYFAGYEYYNSTSGAIFNGLGSNPAFNGSPHVLPADLVAASYSNPNSQHLAELKITYQINPSNSINLIGNLQEINEPDIVSGGFTSPYNNNNTRNGDYAEAVDWTHTFSASAINDLRFNSARDWDDSTCLYATAVGPFNTSTPALTSYGTTPYGNPTGYYASLAYNGGSAVTVGCNGRWGGDHFIGLYGAVYDTFTKNKDHHTVKFGGNFGKPYYGLNATRVNFDGAYSFPAASSFATIIPFNATNSASFPLSYSVTWAPPNRTYDMATGLAFGFFVQDTWRITDRLTLNPGVRWDGDTSYSYFNQHFIAPGGNTVQNDWRTVAPRVGLAYTPMKADPTLVIRGGFGLFYSPTSLTEMNGYISTRYLPQVLDGFTANSTTNNPYCISPGGCGNPTTFAAYQADLKELLAWSLANNTLPDLTRTSVAVGGTTYALPGFTGTIPQGGVYNIDHDKRTPAAIQTTAGVAKTFHNNLNVTVDFLYMNGFDQPLLRNTNVNPQVPAIVTGSTSTTNFLNPAYTSYNSVGNGGEFKDKQLLVKGRYNDHRGDTIAVAYTLSYSTSNSPSGGDFGQHSLSGANISSTNPLDSSLDNGPSITDQRHNLAINGIAKLPFGIRLAPIFTLGTGLPLTPTTTLQANGTSTSGGVTVTTPGCLVYFAQCYPTRNGTFYGKGSLRGDTTYVLNARVERSFKIWKLGTFTPEFEAFNVPNHVNIGQNIQVSAASTTFGQPSSSTVTMRQLQIGARFDF